MGSDGKPLTGAKVGYLVTNPSGKKQKAMTMEMKGGYGADVELVEKGTYTITVKVVKDGSQIVDKFTHEVE